MAPAFQLAPDIGSPAVGRLLPAVELATLLVLVKRRLARLGFQRTVVSCTAVGRRRGFDADEERRVVELAANLMPSVLRWHPVPSRCLEQALVVCWFLGRRGIKAEFVIAVRKYPFEAHAWARWAEVALTSPPSPRPEQFQVIGRF